jgi:hypothetical protein
LRGAGEAHDVVVVGIGCDAGPRGRVVDQEGVLFEAGDGIVRRVGGDPAPELRTVEDVGELSNELRADDELGALLDPRGDDLGCIAP